MPTKAIFQFPRSFLWGTAVAAHQVEGDNHNDWTRWEQQPGHVWNDQPSGGACEWWAGRYEEDFDRASAMRNNSMRLSIEWSRIEPEKDRFDEAAIDRYRDMLSALHERNISPMITLHHFTNPLWLADQGEWFNPLVIERFAMYARYVVDHLKDLCSLWCTIDEPMIYATQSYSFGAWPPGSQSRDGVMKVALNMLYAHAAAYHTIKEIQPESQVGYSIHQLGLEPAAPASINRYAAAAVENYFNRAFVLALRDGKLRLGRRTVSITAARGALDWIGLQYYQVFKIHFDPRSPSSLFLRQSIPGNLPTGPAPWGGLNPDALFKHIQWFERALGKPIYITGCGVPDADDAIRPEYLVRSVHAAWHAVNYNFPVRGFYFKSLLDNFEWDKGYDPRFNFGLYQTDFETQERKPRRSAELYAAICKQNGLSSETVARYVPELMNAMFPGEPGADGIRLRPPKPVTWTDKRSTNT